MVLIYEMRDNEESLGLLETDLNEAVLANEWADYYNNYESENIGIDEFEVLMTGMYRRNEFKRIYLTEIYP